MPLALFQNLFRGPDLLILIGLALVVFWILRRPDDKPDR